MSSSSSPSSLQSQKPWSPPSRRFSLVRRLATKVKSLRNLFSTRTVEPEPPVEYEVICLSTLFPSTSLSLQSTVSSLGSLGSMLEQELERREGREVGNGPITLAWREEQWMARRSEGSQ